MHYIFIPFYTGGFANAVKHGKSPVMPKWAMGFWQSREKYNTQEEMLGALKGFRDRKIPLDNIVPVSYTHLLSE